MRRPIVYVSGSYCFGIGLQYFMGVSVVALVLLFALIICVCGYIFIFKNIIQNKEKFVMACVMAIALILGSINFNINFYKENPVKDFNGKNLSIVGEVVYIQKKDTNAYTMLMKKVDISGFAVSVLVNIYSELEDYQMLSGRKVKVNGRFDIASERRNPNTFDYRLFLKTKNIHGIVTVKGNEIAVGNNIENRLLNKISIFKEWATTSISSEIGAEKTGFLMGMLFGEKIGIDEEVYEAFQKNGTAHVLAVSGLHVGVVYMCINKLRRRKGVGMFDIIVVLLLLLYGTMSLFSPSVTRAIIMIVIHIVAKALHQRYDLLCGSAITMLIMLIWNPLYVLSVGFQLSFIAIFSLAILLPSLERWIGSFPASVIAIQCGMIPITLYTFNYFSLAAFFINIPVIFIGGIIIPIGMGLMLITFYMMLTGNELEILFGVTAKAIETCIDLLINLNFMSYAPGVSYINAISPMIWAVFAVYGIMFFVFSEQARIFFQRKQYKRIVSVIAMCLVASAMLVSEKDAWFNKADVVFVDVGQGDAIHIRTKGGKNVLIDGGGKVDYDVGRKILMPYLLKNRVREIDLAVVTHLHEDHYGGIKALAKEGMIRKLGVFEGNKVLESEILEETGLLAQQIIYLAKGDLLQLEELVYGSILHPEYKEDLELEEDENKNSLVIKLQYNGISILTTGDMDEKGEKTLIWSLDNERDIKTDILKVGHHGSKYSTDNLFLEKTNPTTAVIQVGKNNFGHPGASIIEKLEEKGIMVYRNDQQGAIGVFDTENGGKLVPLISEEGKK